jgi:hypothetical protein
MDEQSRLFERLICDLRAIRKTERQAVEMLIEVANNPKATAEDFELADQHHDVTRGAYFRVLQQLAEIWF